MDKTKDADRFDPLWSGHALTASLLTLGDLC